MSARLYDHPKPPPSLDRLARSPMLRRMNLVRTVWRGTRNLLELFHPDLYDRPFQISKVAGERVISINDADIARHVLLDRADIFPKGRIYKVFFGDFLGESSLTMEKEDWRARRRLIGPAFNARALKGVEPVVERHVAEMLDEWDAAIGPDGTGVADLHRSATRLTMRVAMEAFFSHSLGGRADEIGALMDRIITDAGSPPMADLLNLPGWVPRRSRRRAMGWLREVDAFLYGVIDERLSRRAQGEPDSPDLLDILIHARDDETGAFLDRVAIRNEVMTLFAAGHETTALSLVWGLDRLARETAWQDRLAAGLAGFGDVSAARARSAPMIAETYDEILRLHPPAFSIGRQAEADTEVAGLRIEAGDRVQVVIFMLHRNARYWPSPEVFDPTRFTPEGKAGRHPFAFLPFGAGPRICVGLALAKMEAHLTLARALARFRLAPDGPPPKPLGKITLRTEGPVRLRVSRR